VGIPRATPRVRDDSTSKRQNRRRLLCRARDQMWHSPNRNLDLLLDRRSRTVQPTGSKTTTTPPVHTTLGMKPIDRFGNGLSRIPISLGRRRITDEVVATPERDFRSVKKGQHVYSFQGQRYETPIDLRGRKSHAARHERLHKGQGQFRLPKNERRIGQARLYPSRHGMKTSLGHLRKCRALGSRSLLYFSNFTLTPSNFP